MTERLKKIILLSGIVLVWSSAPGGAKEVNFDITVDKNKVTLGEPVQLSLTFYNVQNIPAPQLPQMDGWEAHYLGPSTRMSIVNGNVSTSVTHMYRLIALRTGTFQLGPFRLEYKGDTFTSNSINVEVVERAPKEEKGQQGKQVELKDKVFLKMEVRKTKVYVNEVIPVVVKLYVSQLAIRDIQYPELPHEGFSLEKFGEPIRKREVLNGVPFDVIEFPTRVFAIREGELTLGPARLNCNLIVKKTARPSSPFDSLFDEDIFEDFFGRYEAYPLNLKSPALQITALSLPVAGRPETFAGAVGSFSLSVQAEPREVKVGDPITVKMLIRGEGNWDTVTCPKFTSIDGFKVYEAQVKQEKNLKIFEQILMPETDRVKEIPPVVFSFFDPIRKEYSTTKSTLIPIKVIKPKQEELKIVEIEEGIVTRPVRKEILGRDIVYIKESPGKMKRTEAYLYRSMGFWFFQVIPLVSLLTAVYLYKRGERVRTDTSYARRLYAPRKARRGIKTARRFLEQGEVSEFYGVIFKTLREYLGDRFHLPSGGITADIVDGVLKAKAIDSEVLDKLRNIFQECDMARYAPSDFRKGEMEQTLKKLEEVFGYLEKYRG